MCSVSATSAMAVSRALCRARSSIVFSVLKEKKEGDKRKRKEPPFFLLFLSSFFFIFLSYISFFLLSSLSFFFLFLVSFFLLFIFISFFLSFFLSLHLSFFFISLSSFYLSFSLSSFEHKPQAVNVSRHGATLSHSLVQLGLWKQAWTIRWCCFFCCCLLLHSYPKNWPGAGPPTGLVPWASQPCRWPPCTPPAEPWPPRSPKQPVFWVGTKKIIF